MTDEKLAQSMSDTLCLFIGSWGLGAYFDSFGIVLACFFLLGITLTVIERVGDKS
jgi:hypothetical protein